MNLLCPNCNKMLTVPEQYAGQLMKCPLCAGTFTVPNMPAFGGPEMAPAFDAPAPPEPAPAPPSPPAPYGVQPDAAPAFPTAPPPAPPPPPAAPEPAFAVSPPPAAPPPLTATTPAPSAPPVTPGGYTTRASVAISDRVLQWVPPACIVLIFLLTFFPWVGVYPGGVAATTQTPWGAAFGGYTQDKDMTGVFHFRDAKELEDINKRRKERNQDELRDHRPGVAILQLFYLIPFLLLTLAASVLVVALHFMKLNLPPAVQQLLPWRWAILFGLNAVLLLFLGMQLVLGYPIENGYTELSKEELGVHKDAKNTEEEKKAESGLGQRLAWLRRTYALRVAVVLHLIATISAGLVYWVERRGPGRPLPRVELMW